MLGARNGGSLAKPPRVRWELGPGNKYAVFLSHYKDEAGMEARYLRDLLQKVLHTPELISKFYNSKMKRW